MANCPSCGAPIDLHLENCPYCGCVIPKEKNIVEQNEQQVIIQQVVQEDPYAKQRELERVEAEYKKKKKREIGRIVAVIIMLLWIPFIDFEDSWQITCLLVGVLWCIIVGIRNIKKIKKEYKQKITQ